MCREVVVTRNSLTDNSYTFNRIAYPVLRLSLFCLYASRTFRELKNQHQVNRAQVVLRFEDTGMHHEVGELPLLVYMSNPSGVTGRFKTTSFRRSTPLE
jgi:hypothetical protein